MDKNSDNIWTSIRKELAEDMQKELHDLHVRFFYSKVQNDPELKKLIKNWMRCLYESYKKNTKSINVLNISRKSDLQEEVFEEYRNLLNVFYHNLKTINDALSFVMERLRNKRIKTNTKIHSISFNKVANQSYDFIFNTHKTELHFMQEYLWTLYNDERKAANYNFKESEDITDIEIIAPVNPEPNEPDKLNYEVTELLKTPENIIKKDPLFAFHLIKKHYPLYGLEMYFYLTRISDLYEIKEKDMVLDSLSQKSDFGYSEQMKRYFITRAIEKLNLIWEDKAELSKLVKVIEPEIKEFLKGKHIHKT